MIICSDCLVHMKTMPDNSVDAIVTDPPYGLSYMGKKWDYDVPSQEIWEQALRVLKPGGYLLAFAGTRTQHRMAVNIEDAGFEIRDMIAWVYGSGFPKSLNIGKVMDKYLKTGNASWNGTGDSSNGALGYSKLQHNQGYRPADYSNKHQNKEEITEDLAKKWEGWGTALKPALEPITVARKQIEGNVAQNCLKWGVGGINIDGCRVGTDTIKSCGGRNDAVTGDTRTGAALGMNGPHKPLNTLHQGRFPANLITDGSDEVVGLFPQTKSGSRKAQPQKEGSWNAVGIKFKETFACEGSEGSASRFFYCAKASKSERNMGCEGLEEKAKVFNGQSDKPSEDMKDVEKRFTTLPKANHHPTVKPIALMEYLSKMVTPKGGIVLDPFMGSGSTGCACVKNGFDFIGIELEPDYCKIAEARINSVKKEPEQEVLL